MREPHTLYLDDLARLLDERRIRRPRVHGHRLDAGTDADLVVALRDVAGDRCDGLETYSTSQKTHRITQ